MAITVSKGLRVASFGCADTDENTSRSTSQSVASVTECVMEISTDYCSWT